MEKVNIDLPTINKNIRMKVGVTLVGDPVGRQIHDQSTLSTKFEFKGSIYTKVTPKFSLVIEIKTPKQETYGYENSVFLPPAFMYQFIRTLEDMIDGFKQEDLFYYDSKGKLQVNKEKSKELEVRFPTPKSEIRLLYAVVSDYVAEDSSSSTDYEGIALIVNDYTNFVYMTYDELRNMHDILSHTDFINLSLHAAIVSANTKMTEGRF